MRRSVFVASCLVAGSVMAATPSGIGPALPKRIVLAAEKAGRIALFPDRRLPNLHPAVINDLQHTLAIRAVLHAEFLDQPCIVDQPVAR